MTQDQETDKTTTFGLSFYLYEDKMERSSQKTGDLQKERKHFPNTEPVSAAQSLHKQQRPHHRKTPQTQLRQDLRPSEHLVCVGEGGGVACRHHHTSPPQRWDGDDAVGSTEDLRSVSPAVPSPPPAPTSDVSLASVWKVLS